ncbi:hypothetical protein J132_00421 [Termitomyces sp. J132]|nr:hypothetical protein J132_00421 [Termitomyces sp. J132]
MSVLSKADALFPKQRSWGLNQSPSPGSKSPRRPTVPLPLVSPNLTVRKRIVVCCDGTWQDGVSEIERSSYTNILRLARMINHEDERLNPLHAIPQVVFYQSGMGSDKNLYSRYVEGTVGGSLGDKVEEAYAFIAHNYHPGDEVFLFGFSRGAYTARMVAMFIGEIGILDRRDMDHFAGIFLAYQKLGKTESLEESASLKQQLLPWTQNMSRGKIRANSQQSKFTIKCLGVFDTVGSIGLPEELVSRSNEVRTIFGFPDKVLGPHVEYAYQALALNETRADFVCRNAFEKLPRPQSFLYILQNCANSHVGIFVLSRTIRRPVPTTSDDVTCETIHASVKEQCLSGYPELQDALAKHPGLVMPLLPLEEEVRAIWPKLLRKSCANDPKRQNT